jgi:hypothetical protein
MPENRMLGIAPHLETLFQVGRFVGRTRFGTNGTGGNERLCMIFAGAMRILERW